MTEHGQNRAGAGPFVLERGPVGVLLIHGYNGSPEELRPMGEALAAQGFSVAGPLLAGHGGTPDQLFGVGWREWLSSTLPALAWLRQRCERVVIAGFSMGGLLAAALAARVPADGVLLMAPALRLHGQQLAELTDIAGKLMPWYYPLAHADFKNPAVRASVRGFVPDADLDDPATVAAIRREARVPVASLYELVRLQRRALRDLPHIHAPALVMQGRNDRTVVPASAELAFHWLSSADKQFQWFEHSGHQLTREAEKEAVWAAAGAWISEHV